MKLLLTSELEMAAMEWRASEEKSIFQKADLTAVMVVRVEAFIWLQPLALIH
jgi:hypothetical protein